MRRRTTRTALLPALGGAKPDPTQARGRGENITAASLRQPRAQPPQTSCLPRRRNAAATPRRRRETGRPSARSAGTRHVPHPATKQPFSNRDQQGSVGVLLTQRVLNEANERLWHHRRAASRCQDRGARSHHTQRGLTAQSEKLVPEKGRLTRRGKAQDAPPKRRAGGLPSLTERLLFPSRIARTADSLRGDKENSTTAFQNLRVHRLATGLGYKERRYPRKDPLASVKLHVSPNCDSC